MKERGLLMEARGNKGIVMTPDGRFESVTVPPGAEVGSEVEFETGATVKGLSRPVSRRRFSLAAIAATLVIALALSVVFESVRAQRTAVAYVEVDINPSVEFGVNKFNRVVSVEGLDEEGRSVVGDLDLKFYELEKAVETLAEAVEERGFLSEQAEVNAVVITVTPAKGVAVAPSLSERVENARKAVSKKMQTANAGVTVQVIHSAPEVRRQAKMMNIPPGRLAIMLKAKDKGIDVEVEVEPVKPEREEKPRGKPEEKPGDKPDDGPGEKREQERAGERADKSADRSTSKGKPAVKVQITPATRLKEVLEDAKEEKDWTGLFKKYGEDIKKEISAEKPGRGEQEKPPREDKHSEDAGKGKDGREKDSGGQDVNDRKDQDKKAGDRDSDDRPGRTGRGSSSDGKNLWERWSRSLPWMRRGEKPNDGTGDTGRNSGRTRD